MSDAATVPRTCAIATCDKSTADLVNHPGRSEPHTALCAHHAEIARDELGAEVVNGL